MTTRLAFILAVLFVGFFVLDHYVLGLDAGLFLLKKLTDVISYMAFWR